MTPTTKAGRALPSHTRLILASEDLLAMWGARTEDGYRITAEWGEELAEGMVGGRSRNDGRQWDIPGSTLDNGKPRRRNTHPTTKPVDLMRHLVRLVTPPGGRILDPFLGSGTTAIAAIMEGFECVGIEQSPEYVAIAEARLNGVQQGIGL